MPKDPKNKKERVFDPEYLAYLEHGESVGVYIVRDKVNDENIDTSGKWIDILKVNAEWESFRYERADKHYPYTRYDCVYRYWDVMLVEAEIFPRINQPVYPKHADKKEKDYICWQTATDDIREHRKQGRKGPRYRIIVETSVKYDEKAGSSKPAADYRIVSLKKL